jgi:hypothetical protein
MPSYKRGDVVEVNFYFPAQGINLPHMVVVLSVQSVCDYEDTFVCVPISSSEEYDGEYNFPIDPSNFENGRIRRGWIRIHLIATMHVSEVTNNHHTRMTPKALERLYNQINTDVFGLVDRSQK